MEVGLLTAFLGGVLALLSPCGALLLPGFFASTVTTRARLIPHAAVFYVGLAITLVPLGVGAGALGALLVSHRPLLIIGTSILLVVLGVMQMLGLGFDLARIVPGMGAAQQASTRGTGYLRTFLLGAVGGIAGFCAGPILGAVLTLALGQGSMLLAGILLAVYGAGMVVPLMILAALWGRLGPRARSLLRGREFTLLGRRLQTTSFITGLVIIALGIVFWATNGLVTMPSLVSTSVLSKWQESSSFLADPTVEIAVIIGLGVIALLLWWLSDRRLRHRRTGSVGAVGPVGPVGSVGPASPVDATGPASGVGPVGSASPNDRGDRS